MKRLREFLKRRSRLRRFVVRARMARDERRLANAWADLPGHHGTSEEPLKTLIFSRFGEETVGNQFIQLGLLRVLFAACPARPIYFLSTAPEVTAKGIQEMLELLRRNADTAPLRCFIANRVFVVGEGKIRSLTCGDLLILGGGPIMDDPSLVKWHLWFAWARRAGARIWIAGCGLGPLRERRYIARVDSMLAMAHAVTIRNKPSPALAAAAGSRLHVALDPAFLCLCFLAPLVGTKRPLFAINTRILGFECNPNHFMSADEVVNRVVQHALPMARQLNLNAVIPFSTCEAKAAPDSEPSQRVAELLAGQLGTEQLALPTTSVCGLVDALLPAEFLLSTRMHGSIIGLMLGCRTANLDYIGGGGKGTDLYREWLGRPAAASLFTPGSLQREDFLLLSEVEGLQSELDTLLATYTTSLHAALAAS